jgi:tetratricopeptide (TPR) repeat protein
MKPSASILLALAAALVPAPLAAEVVVHVVEPEPEPLPDLSAMSGEEVLALFRKTSGRWLREPCTFGVPVTTALEEKIGKTGPIRRARLYAAAICADREQRYAEGAALVRELNSIDPAEQDVSMALYFARRLEDAEMALAILGGLDGKPLGELERDEFWAVARMVGLQQRGRELDALALRWADEGKFAFIDGDLHEGLAIRSLREAARTGRSDLVEPLLLSITTPVSYIDLLTSRDYELFWPQIEARAGANLATIGAEHVRMTAARLTNAASDRDRLSDAAHALHYNGQYADAIALARRWRERAGPDTPFEEGDGWALNIEAYAHDALGQPDKADAVFEELAKLDPDEHPWVVNFVINRASRLVGQGRWKEGLAASKLARAVAEKYGSTYAKMIIARDRACALERLGRAEEAAGELAYLRANWKDAVEFAVRGLMCHDFRDEAAGLLLQGLRDETVRDSAIGAFLTDELDLFYTASILPDARDVLATSPELADELDKHMRAMPEAYIPQAALRRIALQEGPKR